MIYSISLSQKPGTAPTVECKRRSFIHPCQESDSSQNSNSKSDDSDVSLDSDRRAIRSEGRAAPPPSPGPQKGGRSEVSGDSSQPRVHREEGGPQTGRAPPDHPKSLHDHSDAVLDFRRRVVPSEAGPLPAPGLQRGGRSEVRWVPSQPWVHREEGRPQEEGGPETGGAPPYHPKYLDDVSDVALEQLTERLSHMLDVVDKKIGHPDKCTPCRFHCFSWNTACRKGHNCEYCHETHRSKRMEKKVASRKEQAARRGLHSV